MVEEALAAVSRLQEISEVPPTEGGEVVVEWDDEREEFTESVREEIFEG